MKNQYTNTLRFQLPNGSGKTNPELRRITQRSENDKKALDGGTVIVITREEVENLDLSQLVATFVSSPNKLRKLQGRVVFSFAGYDDDPGELYEIPSIREYMLLADRYRGGWFFFSELGSTVLKTLMCCLLQNLVSTKLTDQPYHEIRVERNDILSFFEEHLEATAILHEMSGFSKQAGVKQLKAVAKYLGFE